jgi:GTPase SAR1 family protein
MGEDASTTTAAREVVALAQKAATAYKRDDLGRRLEQAQRRLDDPGVRVLVVGEFKKGKSSLVNALLGHPICPVDDDVATCVPTIVRYGANATAELHLRPDADGDPPQPQVIAVDELRDHVSERGNAANIRGIERAEVAVPSALLEQGLTLVDTPGVGGLGSKHGAMTMGVLPSADAVILVSDASQEYTDPELKFLQRARDLCPNLIAVVTKIDLYPEWRRIAEIDAAHLDQRGFAVRLFPFSSSLRQLALDTRDEAAEEESGYPALAGYLQLAATFESERSVLTDAASGEKTLTRLEEARSAASRLMGQAARWQYTLNDGIADLNADLDHDFRNRMRSLTARAEDAIDAADPAEVWEEFEAWLEQAMSHEVVESFALLNRRTQELGARVAEHFAEDEVEVTVAFNLAAPVDAFDAVRRGGISLEKLGLASAAMTALKGSYGGVLMFGMIARMIGVVALNPLVGVAGVLMGGKAIRDERARALKQRRQDAKLAVRRYIDDVGFSVGKEVRDAGRRTHRDLRDLFAERAEVLQRSTSMSLAATQQAIDVGAGDRAARLKAVEAELKRIARVRDRALALAPELSAP